MAYMPKMQTKEIMSELTPRTDAESEWCEWGEVVSAVFSEELERENNELIRDIANRDISIIALADQGNDLADENNELRELVNLITKQEMDDDGRLFYTSSIGSVRCRDLERMGEITEKYRKTPHITTEDYHE